MSDLILYTSEDGQTRLQLRANGKTVWLTQLEIAELFQTTKHNISIHTKNIFKEGELAPEATVKESLTVQSEGGRQVQRTITYFNLDLILAIGYRAARHAARSSGNGRRRICGSSSSKGSSWMSVLLWRHRLPNYTTQLDERSCRCIRL